MLPGPRKSDQLDILDHLDFIVAMALAMPISMVITAWKYGLPMAWSTLSSPIGTWEQLAWAAALFFSTFALIYFPITKKLLGKEDETARAADPLRRRRAPAWLDFGKPLIAVAAVGLIDNGWWALAALVGVWIVGFAVTYFVCPFEGEFAQQFDRLSRATMQKGYVCPGCFADLPQNQTAGACQSCRRPFTDQDLLADWRLIKSDMCTVLEARQE